MKTMIGSMLISLLALLTPFSAMAGFFRCHYINQELGIFIPDLLTADHPIPGYAGHRKVTPEELKKFGRVVDPKEECLEIEYLFTEADDYYYDRRYAIIKCEMGTYEASQFHKLLLTCGVM